jgi:hypothetical protein
MNFVFRSFSFEREQGLLRLHYGFEWAEQFEEVISFPLPLRELSADENAALEQAFRLVFLLSGVSYYKARVPELLVCSAFPLAPELARFVEKNYLLGLGEFAHKNNLSLKLKVGHDPAARLVPRHLALPRLTCVPVGGGKDSTVTIETLKAAGEPLVLFASGTSEPIAKTIAVSGLPSFRIIRKLDPLLMKLNAEGAYNGHVPITAILSAIAVACAILYGFDTIALSNEHSASEPNFVKDGVAVNHQYSKSLEFEREFASMVAQCVSPDIHYFSFLRPLTEAAITKRFATLDKYHAVFRSCNTAFKLDETKRGKNWCCNCPKCRFVFLALAPFMDKAKLVDIFGSNLVDDNSQLEGFAELAGLSAFKPFECVGTVEESALLLAKLTTLPEWKDDAVVKTLGPKLHHDEAKFARLFDLRPDHALPQRFLEMLHAAE